MKQAMHRAAKTIGILFVVAACASRPTPTPTGGITGRGASKDHWFDALPRSAWSAYPQVAQDQSWFEVYRLENDLFAIYEPGQFEEVISYLIVGTDKALLLDTGLGIGDMQGLVAELTDRPIVVLNSHTHYDHVGGNHQFESVLGVNSAYSREHGEGRSQEELAEFVSPAWIAKDLPEGFDAERFVSKPFAITAFVTDGQFIELGGRRLEVLLTPGHTPDSLCLLDRERRLLFTGDTLYPATLYVHLADADVASYQRSALRLAGLADEVDWVLPGHNEPFMHPSSLGLLATAFEAIGRADTPFQRSGDQREYDFGAFSLLVSEP